MGQRDSVYNCHPQTILWKKAFEPGEGRWLIPQTEHVQTREPLEPKQRNDYRRETPDDREQPDLSNQAHQNA
jgi:hypothetical protein